MLVFLPASALETLANMLLLRTNMIGVTWSLQVEMVGSLAIALMWLLGRHSRARMMVALAVAIAVVPLARATVLVFLPAFAFGGLISAVPAYVWSSRALLWAGLTVLLIANLFFGHGGVARCFEIVGATAVVGCIGSRPLAFLQSAPVQLLGAISYPLYLIYPFSALASWQVLAPFPPQQGLPGFALAAAASLAIAIPLAWLLHIGIEVPCMRRRPRLAVTRSASDGPMEGAVVHDRLE
jgi:peptidoglycan/LPS O-acetylase OafA/YrhL